MQGNLEIARYVPWLCGSSRIEEGSVALCRVRELALKSGDPGF